MAIRLLVMLVALVSTARADDLAAYRGQIVISPDPVPTAPGELPKFLAANASKDGHYDLIHGPPWDMNLVGVASADPGNAAVTLLVTDASDAKAAPLVSIAVAVTRRIVIAHTSATIAAGFAAGKTYLVRLVRGKTVLAKAELGLR